MTQEWDGIERRGGKERRSGKERRKVKKPITVNKRIGKDRRSGLDRRHMTKNLCPHIESPECAPWRERTLGNIIHISRYCRDYFVFCQYYKEIKGGRG